MRRTFLSIAIASTVGLAAAGSAWAQAPLKKVTIVIEDSATTNNLLSSVIGPTAPSIVPFPTFWSGWWF